MTKLMKQMIKQVADILIESSSSEIPIDLEKLVASLGGRIKMSAVETGSFVKRMGRSFVILIPLNQSEQQTRFVIAQELGHLFLHMGFPKEKNEQLEKELSRLSTYELECQANEFADCLLMPEKAYAKKIRNSVDTQTKEVDIETVAEYFNVTKSAVINRGRHLEMLDLR